MLLFTDGLVERRGRPMASSLTQLAEIIADLAQAPSPAFRAYLTRP